MNVRLTGEAEIRRRLDAAVARRKRKLAEGMRRVASRLGEWTEEDGIDGARGSARGSSARIAAAVDFGAAAREGRWAELWASVEARRGELLRVLAGRDGR